MKQELIYIPTSNMSPGEWLKYRDTGIGASEVGTVMGLNPYKSSVQLFYEKVGMIPVNQIENMAMFMGKQTEAFIADLWQYWDGDEESVIRNFNAGNMVRRCSRVNAFVRNNKYPWLFVSLDRRIHKNGEHGEGALECKNMSYHVAKKWEGGIPPMYIVQVQTQILVTEFLYAEMAVLQDGRHFMAYPFTPEKGIIKHIIKVTKDFWQRVVKAREYYGQLVHARAQMNYRQVEYLQGKIDQLEPPPDNSESYRQFMNDKYVNSTAGETIGTEVELNKALEHKKIKAKINKLREDAQGYENALIKSMAGFQKMTFGESGFISYRADANGSMRFLNHVK